MSKVIIYLFIFGLLIQVDSNAQDKISDSIALKYNQYEKQVFEEKLFVHTDKSFYITGERLFFKVYNVEADKFVPVNLSKVAYIELLDENNTIVLNTKVKLTEAGGDGMIFLPASLNSGNFILRAYSRWMRNFSPSYYFHKSISIFNPFKPIPITEGKKMEYNIQFFPEGGNLVNNLESKIGFRIVDEDGRGVDLNGAIFNEAMDTVVRFQPLKFGIGSFHFIPKGQQRYKAQLYNDEGDVVVESTLPEIHEVGYTMGLKPAVNTISILINTNSNEYNEVPVTLFVHSGGEILKRETRALNENSAQFIVSNSLLVRGINYFTLFNHLGEPICERLYFRRPNKNLNIEVSTNKNTYRTREKINLNYTVKNASTSQLSLAVYRIDELQTEEKLNIENYLILKSNLRGNIESPWFYFSNDAVVTEATDNLMLTHGWRSFDWNHILNKVPLDLEFIPEFRGPLVEGIVTDRQTKDPVSNVTAYLTFTGKDFVLRGAKSDQLGHVRFELNDLFQEGKIYIRLDTAFDNQCILELLPSFSLKFDSFKVKEFSIPLALKSQLEERSVSMQVNNLYSRDTLPASMPMNELFYGLPDERFFLDSYSRFPVMDEVMREFVRGVVARKVGGQYYFQVYNLNTDHLFNTSPLVLLDGVPVFDLNRIMALDPLKVEKIDVMRRKEFFGALSAEGVVSFVSYDGKLAQQIIGDDYLNFDFQGLQQKRIFFTPDYEITIPIDSRMPDYRELLYWNGNLPLDEEGNGAVSFYSSDLAGIYMILINGLSTDGLLGSAKGEFEIAKVKNP